MHIEDFSDMVYFAGVVEHGGFTAASRVLGIPKSRLSRRIAELEDRLGVRLLQRTSRKLAVTTIGRLFYERCQAMVAMGHSARDVVSQAVAEPHGTVRLSSPITLAQHWLTPLLPKYLLANPRVRLDLMVTNRPVDPIEEGVDVVLRVRRPPVEDSGLVLRRLGRVTDVLVAAPSFLSKVGRPTLPSDLERLPTLSLPERPDRFVWKVQCAEQIADIVHSPRLVSEDMLAIKRAAVDGVGIALLPDLICGEEIRHEQLEVVLPEWCWPGGEIQALFPSRRGMVPAVRRLIDLLADNPPDSSKTAAN